jgi:hypothetical protein
MKTTIFYSKLSLGYVIWYIRYGHMSLQRVLKKQSEKYHTLYNKTFNVQAVYPISI